MNEMESLFHIMVLLYWHTIDGCKVLLLQIQSHLLYHLIVIPGVSNNMNWNAREAGRCTDAAYITGVYKYPSFMPRYKTVGNH